MATRTQERLAQMLLAVVPTVIAGCKGTRGFTEDLCTGHRDLFVPEFNVLGSVKPAEPVDAIELRLMSHSGLGGWPSPGTVLDRFGQPCGQAADRKACERAFSELPAVSTFPLLFLPDDPGYLSLAINRGDTVHAVTDRIGLAHFLGAIDAPGDAVLQTIMVMEGHSVVCGPELDTGVRGQGYVVQTESGNGCTTDHQRHVVFVGREGMLEVLESEVIAPMRPGCVVGRLPHGLCAGKVVRSLAARPIGSFFAAMARLEAAAVAAFERLAAELTVHGAPPSMVAAADRSRIDEVRHARAAAHLARRSGAIPSAPRITPAPVRSLLEVALDNATEGCVNETYGAAVAHYQARTASDPLVRATLARIAQDETRHAALSWSVAEWLEPHLSRIERNRVARAIGTAFERLDTELHVGLADEIHELAGVPQPRSARALLHQLGRTWF